jgi:hypothetical protein
VGRLTTSAFIFVFISASAVYSQRYEITNRPDNHVVPARCVYSQDSISGEFAFEFYSEGTRAAALTFERSDTLTIKLIPHRLDLEGQITFAGGEQAAVICPPNIELVRILLCHDSALIEMSGGRAKLSRETAQLVMDSGREIPKNVLLVQGPSKRTASSHALIAAALLKFPGVLEQMVLEAGIYPSLEFPVVQVANIGRRQRVNETAGGYLIAFRVLDERKSGDIADWLEKQERDL